MSEPRTEEREAFLYYFVFGTEQAQELMALWKKDILETSHFQPQTDPNSLKTIRDMAILEFIQGIQNRVDDFIEKGVKDGPTEPDPERVNPGDTNTDNRTGTDTGNPDL